MRFENVRMVLVDTTHPGNIGATARAMKTMCLDQLYLVNPQRYPSAEATARASGADDLLAKARVCDSLEAAIGDCALVIGASARHQRRVEWPVLDPRQCAARVGAGSDSASVAIVFGREHSGLTNEELERCHYLVNIPSNAQYSSLNLAAAVQVIAYELMMASAAEAPAQAAEQRTLASAQELAMFYAHMEQALIEIGFLDPASPRHLMRKLRRLFNRSALEPVEINILRGILTAAQAAQRGGEPRPGGDTLNHC